MTAIAFAVNLLVSRELISASFKIQNTVESLIRRFGSLTFPLYCMHYPAICLLAAISPWKNTTFLNLAFIGWPTFLLVVGLTPM